jgi:hypothetical protein
MDDLPVGMAVDTGTDQVMGHRWNIVKGGKNAQSYIAL